MDRDHMRGEAVAALRDTYRRLRRTLQAVEAHDDARDELLDIAAEIAGAARKLYGDRPNADRGRGARHRILAYLIAHVGEDVSGEQLATVSGIPTWSRRVRELRVEHGYDIVERGGSTYRLLSPEPDVARAARWHRIHEIRRRGGDALERVEALLTAFAGETVTREEVDYVARSGDGDRYVRVLRDRHGLDVASSGDAAEPTAQEYRLCD